MEETGNNELELPYVLPGDDDEHIYETIPIPEVTKLVSITS